jgi:hypothetical protein
MSGPQQPEVRIDIQSSLNRTIKTMQLLRRVRSHTSTAIKAWKEFSARNGDMRFLHNHRDHKTKISLNRIRDSFFNLAILEEKLVALDKTCEESAKIVSRYLIVYTDLADLK